MSAVSDTLKAADLRWRIEIGGGRVSLPSQGMQGALVVNIVETDYWCLMLPPEWSAEEEEGSVLITDQDGIGELAITTLVREPDDAPETSVSEIAQLESPEVSGWATATFGDFSGVTGQFTEEGAVLQEWYLSHGVALLYCTYACDAEDAGMDMPAVEEILGTLVPGDALLVG